MSYEDQIKSKSLKEFGFDCDNQVLLKSSEQKLDVPVKIVQKKLKFIDFLECE